MLRNRGRTAVCGMKRVSRNLIFRFSGRLVLKREGCDRLTRIRTRKRKDDYRIPFGRTAQWTGMTEIRTSLICGRPRNDERRLRLGRRAIPHRRRLVLLDCTGR